MTHPLSEEALSRGENMMCPPSASDEASSGKQSSAAHPVAMAYVVMGTTGEYSDRTEWPVAAYLNENEAEAHVRRAVEWLEQNYDPNDYSFDKYAWLETKPNPHDPDMRVDYTGTDWFVYGPLPLQSGLPSVSDEQPKAEDAQAAEPEGCQRGGEAETPNPLPADQAEVVKRLRSDAEYPTSLGRVGTDASLLERAATLITSQAEEIRSRKGDLLTMEVNAAGWKKKYRSLQSDIERITKELQEAGKALVRLTPDGSEFHKREGDKYVVDWKACISYLQEYKTRRHESMCEAVRARKAAESSLASMTARCKELETADEIVKRLVVAKDVWTDYGSGFRIHFSFAPGADMEVVTLINTARALSQQGGGRCVRS